MNYATLNIKQQIKTWAVEWQNCCTNPLFTIWVDVSVNASCDAIDSDGFLLEASVVILEAPHDCSVWIFFAIFPQNLCDWFFRFVIGVVWFLVRSLFVKVLSARPLRLLLLLLWLGNIALLLHWSRSLDVKTLCIRLHFLLLLLLLDRLLRFGCEQSAWWRWWSWLMLVLWILIIAILSHRLGFVEETSFGNRWLWSLRLLNADWTVNSSSAIVVLSDRWQGNSAGNIQTRRSIKLCKRRRQTAKLERKEEESLVDAQGKAFGR